MSVIQPRRNDQFLDDSFRFVDGPSYRDLYYRWEHEQWSAGDIDLSTDAAQWGDLSDGLKRSLLWHVSSFGAADERLTQTLVPYVDAAPTEEQQVFLSSQLVDVARHLVLFDRFLEEVVGEGGDMPARLGRQTDRLNDGSRELLLEMLPDVSSRIRGDGGLDALVEGVVLQHLVIEGTLAATTRRSLLGFLRESQLLRGLVEGLSLVERDGTRHLEFAVRFLTDAIAFDARYADVVRTTLTGNPVGWSVLQPPHGDHSYFDPLPYSADDITSAAQLALDDILRTIGVDLAA